MSPARDSAFPARPTLRPGVRVTRREDGHLQVGLAEDLALTTPDTPQVRALLQDLVDGVQAGPPDGPPDGTDLTRARLCFRLLTRGLVVDGDALLSALGTASTAEERGRVAADFADHGLEAVEVLARRRATAVEIVAVDAARERDRLVARMQQAGLNLAGELAGDRAGDLSTTSRPAAVAVLLTRGEPARERLDPWLRQDVAHLLVTVVEGRVRLGPFVQPGRTACQRCIDAHLGERDPRRALVVEQYATRPRGERGGVPEPVPDDLVDLALVWAVRDVAAWVDGRRPATWSTTVTVDPAMQLLRTTWRPHAACGCTWQHRFVG